VAKRTQNVNAASRETLSFFSCCINKAIVCCVNKANGKGQLKAGAMANAFDGVTDLASPTPSQGIHPAFAHLLAAARDPETRRRRRRRKWDLLEQHEEIIREVRAGEHPLTYRQISELLGAQGVKISHQVIARFCQAKQIGWEATAAADKGPSRATKKKPRARPGST
jgi:hypothetical protein